MPIEFEEEKYSAPIELPDQPSKGLTGALIKSGIVKNSRQASYVYVALIVILIGVIFFALSTM